MLPLRRVGRSSPPAKLVIHGRQISQFVGSQCEHHEPAATPVAQPQPAALLALRAEESRRPRTFADALVARCSSPAPSSPHLSHGFHRPSRHRPARAERGRAEAARRRQRRARAPRARRSAPLLLHLDLETARARGAGLQGGREMSPAWAEAVCGPGGACCKRERPQLERTRRCSLPRPPRQAVHRCRAPHLRIPRADEHILTRR